MAKSATAAVSELEPKSESEPFLRVAACSYEGSLFGWEVREDMESSQSGLLMEMKYGFNCCQASLRALAVSESGKYLACAGMDERIRIFDVAENRSILEMSNHSGAINCLHFVGDAYLFSGSEDSTISIWRIYDGVCVHILGGHKGAVLSMAIHPSGKLALTTAKDSTIKMWNLVHGRCAFTRRLKACGDKICWDEAGEHYLVVAGSHLQVFSASDNACCFEVLAQSRVNSAVFTVINGGDNTDNGSDKELRRVAVICENKQLHLYTMNGQETARLDLNSLGGRPRDMSSCVINDLAKSSLQSAEATIVLGDVRSVLAIATSNGSVSVLCASSLETSAKATANATGKATGSLEQCQIVSATIRVEPRLIATVCWNLSKRSGLPQEKTQSHHHANQQQMQFHPEAFDKSTQPKTINDIIEDNGDDAGDSGKAANKKRKQASSKEQEDPKATKTSNPRIKQTQGKDENKNKKQKKKVTFSKK